MRPDLPLILATDLDGTFLHGSDADKAFGYGLLRRHRDTVGLLYVTGRELERVTPLCADPSLPRPDHIIADVGTVAVDGATFEPFRSLQAWVEARWGDANGRVRALLAEEAGLTLQPVTPAWRVSYYYDPDHLNPATIDRIVAAGFDCLLSDERYLDVLPPGVAKGSMLLRLLDHLAVPRDTVVVCGDTLNDLSLFRTGLLGIVVGNAEAKLLDAVADRETVYCSAAPGIAGILEGVCHWNRVGALPDHPLYAEAVRERFA